MCVIVRNKTVKIVKDKERERADEEGIVIPKRNIEFRMAIR